jgi:ribosome biogenesis GTPase
LTHERHPLAALGWNERIADALDDFDGTLTPGRIAVEHRGAYVVLTAEGELWAETSGAFRHRASGRHELPCVGDWVALDARVDEGRATIHHVLPRRTSFSRNVAGFETDEQVLAANIDVAFLIAALNADLNMRRLERYLTMAWASGAQPVVVLSKADLCPDLDDALRQVHAVALGVPVHVTSVVTGEGVDELRAYLTGERTAVLLGSSGAGKSSLINELVGESLQVVQEIREDGRGRHTTTRRELVVLASGGVLIDTPGLRELQLWNEADGLDTAFGDITDLAAGCRFRDCRHEQEPGCAVKEALAAGTLERGRYDGFKKLERELHYLHVKQDRRAAANERRKWKAITKDYRRRTQLG